MIDFPPNPSPGEEFTDSNGTVWVWNGTVWAVSSAPATLYGEAGSIAMYAGINEPIGWLHCDGRAISRASYPFLFQAIGTDYGDGDGSTTFNIPDLRGEFIRGFDAGRGVDAGRVFGSNQAGNVSTHQHATASPLGSSGVSWSFTSWPYGAAPGEPTRSTAGGGGANPGSQVPRNSGPPNSVEDDNRPRNVAVWYIIKT